MKNNKDTTETSDELLHDLQTLIADAQALVARSATDLSTEAIDALRARFAAARERVTDAYAEARKKIVAGARYTDETIRENPYQSLAVAAGIGLLVGIIVGRRSK